MLIGLNQLFLALFCLLIQHLEVFRDALYLEIKLVLLLDNFTKERIDSRKNLFIFIVESLDR